MANFSIWLLLLAFCYQAYSSQYAYYDMDVGASAIMANRYKNRKLNDKITTTTTTTVKPDEEPTEDKKEKEKWPDMNMTEADIRRIKQFFDDFDEENTIEPDSLVEFLDMPEVVNLDAPVPDPKDLMNTEYKCPSKTTPPQYMELKKAYKGQTTSYSLVPQNCDKHICMLYQFSQGNGQNELYHVKATLEYAGIKIWINRDQSEASEYQFDFATNERKCIVNGGDICVIPRERSITRIREEVTPHYCFEVYSQTYRVGQRFCLKRIQGKTSLVEENSVMTIPILTDPKLPHVTIPVKVNGRDVTRIEIPRFPNCFEEQPGCK